MTKKVSMMIMMVVMIIMIVMMVILMIMMTKNMHISLVLSKNVPILGTLIWWKKGQQIQAWVNPSPLFRQCPKVNDVFLLMSSLRYPISGHLLGAQHAGKNAGGW